MRRRTCLTGTASAAAVAGGVVGAVLGFDAPTASEPEPDYDYRDDARVVYDHDSLELRVRPETVRLGETAAFAVTNTDDSPQNLGCNNPWAIQRYSDGEWRHVAWTGKRYFQLCLTMLSPGGTHVERVTLSEPDLERRTNDVRTELRPGRYRLLVLGPSPFLAADFGVLTPE